ncbi:MAG: cell wall hydrolase [Gammaproteobacteria bacterium]|nr:cell wall hydrolase [Gammaproteobacteria bacterium]
MLNSRHAKRVKMNSVGKILAFLIPRKFHNALKLKWKSFGQMNQILIASAAVVSVAMSVSIIMFVSQQDKIRDIKCLAMNVYHEARGEPILGQYAVAAVTMNRVKSQRHPNEVCRVVYLKAWSKKYQRISSAFSWTSDGLDDIPKENDAWKNALSIARQVYKQDASGIDVNDHIKGALFYHADYVSPRWAVNKLKTTQIGKHIFYK